MCAPADAATKQQPLRPIPLLTQINIYLINVVFAALHIILEPTGIEPVVSAFAVGNLFGLIIPCFGVIALLVHVIVGPILNLLLPGAYETYVLEYKWQWAGALFLVNVVVGLLDNSHHNVAGANNRLKSSNNPIIQASNKFWESSFEYVQMNIKPWKEGATLPPDRQYIFACHPHGIHCMPLAIFHCKGTPFDKVFPGICENKLSGLAASVVFRLPGVREFFLSMPYIDASRHVVERALKADRSIFVCTGSGEESLLTKQGEDTLVLSRRKGFIRLALSYGCDVVPIFGVGNSDLFKTYSWGMGVRMWLQKRAHVSIPIFHGKYFTPLPYKKPVTVLVGEPLTVPVPKVRGERPDEELVEKYLKIYIERVKELHKTNTTGRKLHII
eukprot:scaffold22712_cov78-Cyclotella_meneghiniana.AAC.4